MKKNQSNVMDDILVKYLAGEADEAEQAQVQQWLQESNGHKKYFYDLKLIWNLSAHTAAASAVNEDEAWERFIVRAKGKNEELKAVKPYHRAYVNSLLKWAAVLLVMIGGGWLALRLSRQDNGLQIQAANKRHKDTISAIATVNAGAAITSKKEDTGIGNREIAMVDKTPPVTARHETKTAPGNSPSVAIAKAPKHPKEVHQDTKEFFCNNTPCPIQIRISETMKCPNNKPSAISATSTLEPDQSGELDYKGKSKMAKNCSLTVHEIEIKSIGTGEMIILNEHSSPSTAQELFSYMTRQKKGELLAGKFHSDCNNHVGDHELVFDSNAGNWIMQ